MTKKFTVSASLVALGTLLIGCAELNSPGQYPVSSPPYGYGYPPRSSYYDNYGDYRRERNEIRRDQRELDDERRELDRQKFELLQQQKRLDQERQERRHQERREQERQHQEDRCPAGWHPSERKCTKKERNAGCQDMRRPSGLGCVRGR